MKLNTRGRTLVKFMEISDFILLNGRSSGDTPANYTFVGPQDFSVIDLVWCSIVDLLLFCDFRVLRLPTLFDHFPVMLTLTDRYSNVNLSPPRLKERIRFDISKANAFTEMMEWRGEVPHLREDVDTLNETLTSTIGRVAVELGMGRPPRRSLAENSSKP